MVRKKYGKKTKMKCKESQGKNKTSRLVDTGGAFHGSYSCLKTINFTYGTPSNASGPK